MTAKNSSITFAAVAGGVISVATSMLLFNVASTSSIVGYLSCLALPGAMVSMIVSGNVHGTSPVIATLFNWLLYSGLVAILLKAIEGSRGK